MGLPGVSARGVSGPGRAPPYGAVPARRDGRGGGGRSPQAQTPTSVQSLGKKLKTVYFKRFPRKLEK